MWPDCHKPSNLRIFCTAPMCLEYTSRYFVLRLSVRGLLMRRFTIALVTAASTTAFAQMASAAPPPPPPRAYNWTGFYIGVNGGFSAGKADTDFNAASVTVNTHFPTGSFNIPGFVGSESAHLNGLIGGGQIGYNWQFSPNWVVGLEADIQASGEKGSKGFSNPFNFTVPGLDGPIPVIGAAVTDYEAKILWFGTVRGRIGYAWDRVMLYATGGLAYGEIKVEGTNTVSGVVGGLPSLPFLAVIAMGHSKVNVGWTVGAGIEGALVDHWTWKAEYLYIDLGSVDDPDIPIGFINATGGRVTTHTNFTDNVVRLGLNYKF